MKKILLSAVVAIAAFSLVFAQDSKEPPKVDYQAIGSPLPNLRIVDSNSKAYTDKDFKGKNYFFLFMFNPTCGHCINMAKLVCSNYKDFKNNKIAFMAGPQMTSYLGSFYQATEIGKFPAIKVGVDSAYAIEKVYNYTTLPQLNIYDNKNKLVKVFHGDIPLDSLKMYTK